MLEEPITGKVARILSAREIAINLGSHNGVKVGMAFDVMNPKGDLIQDPDTGSTLGSVVLPKVRVRISQVNDRVSVATTSYSIGVSQLGTFAKLFLSAGRAATSSTLRRDNSNWEDLDEIESFVKIGDPVVQVVEEPETESVRNHDDEQPSSS